MTNNLCFLLLPNTSPQILHIPLRHAKPGMLNVLLCVIRHADIGLTQEIAISKMPGDNVNKQAEQQGSGDREQGYRVKKPDAVWAPNADYVKMKDHDGNVMETVVNTTPGHDPTAAFFARTAGGGYIGVFNNPEDAERMAERVMLETGCEEFHTTIIPYDSEMISKFEETAVEKRVISNYDFDEAETSEPNPNTKNN